MLLKLKDFLKFVAKIQAEVTHMPRNHRKQSSQITFFNRFISRLILFQQMEVAARVSDEAYLQPASSVLLLCAALNKPTLLDADFAS